MKVFLSWSGEVSRKSALAIKKWFKLMNQSVDYWMSEQDIQKGTIGIVEIAKSLAECKYGLICVTPDNINSLWLHFEAGALFKSYIDSHISPLILGLQDKDIKRPLSDFQYTLFAKDDMLRLLCGINDASEVPTDKALLESAFAVLWPNLEKELEEILSSGATTKNAAQVTTTNSNEVNFSEELNLLLNEIRDVRRMQDRHAIMLTELSLNSVEDKYSHSRISKSTSALFPYLTAALEELRRMGIPTSEAKEFDHKAIELLKTRFGYFQDAAVAAGQRLLRLKYSTDSDRDMFLLMEDVVARATDELSEHVAEHKSSRPQSDIRSKTVSKDPAQSK